MFCSDVEDFDGEDFVGAGRFVDGAFVCACCVFGAEDVEGFACAAAINGDGNTTHVGRYSEISRLVEAKRASLHL